MKAEIIPYILKFKQPAGTSRGVLITKETWFLKVEDQNRVGWGEIGMFKGLSADDKPDFTDQLKFLVSSLNNSINSNELLKQLIEWPSIRFGLEQAIRSLKGVSSFDLFPSPFTEGISPIPINGLIWMGDYSFMKNQISTKIAEGFTCIKLKIGAIDFRKEIALLESIRKDFEPKEIEIRVDANGSFLPKNALVKMEELSKYCIHSIEQPIKQGQLENMAHLCANSSLPIALDEELIGINEFHEKQRLLETIKPNYIILKPTLIGGFTSCDEWIQLAEEHSIGWWITSALESNIGLNAIAQYVATKKTNLPQGLGTGGLFTNNIASPLEVKKGQLSYHPSMNWDLTRLENA